VVAWRRGLRAAPFWEQNYILPPRGGPCERDGIRPLLAERRKALEPGRFVTGAPGIRSQRHYRRGVLRLAKPALAPVPMANRRAGSTAERQHQNGERKKFSIRAEADRERCCFGVSRGEWFRLLMFDLGAVVSGTHSLAVLCSRTHHGVEARENRER
jgi:hypothetical protein